jgi:hypothetical protein
MDCKQDAIDFGINGEEYEYFINKRFGNIVLFHFRSKRKVTKSTKSGDQVVRS